MIPLKIGPKFLYKYDIFISYSTIDTQIAEKFYKDLSSLGLKIFYAPKTLRTSKLTPNQFFDILRDALMSSCMLVSLVSEAYLDSSWCQLELRGYFYLFLSERRRKMWIKSIDPGVDDQLAGQLVPLIFKGDFKTLVSDINAAIKHREIHIEEEYAKRERPQIFVKLQLRRFYEPPNRPPWGKDSQSPHGVPGAPHYDLYEYLVREYMIQLLRGRDPSNLVVPMLNLPESYSYMTHDAKKDAKKLIDLGISPYQRLYHRNLAEWLFDIEKASKQGRDPYDLKRLLGKAYAEAGHFNRGIKLMRGGLKDDKISTKDKDYQIIQIAMAEYGAKRYELALKTLEELSGSHHMSHNAELVRAAALARLGRLNDEEKEQNRNSKVQINEIRFYSTFEHRENLDHWAEGLEMAGFQF